MNVRTRCFPQNLLFGVAIFGLFAVTPVCAKADGVPTFTVTSGSMNDAASVIAGSPGEYNFSFSGPGFTMTGNDGDDSTGPIGPYDTGQPISPNGGLPQIFGEGTFNGVVYDMLMGGALNITGAPLITPGGVSSATLVGPVDFSGVISVCNDCLFGPGTSVGDVVFNNLPGTVTIQLVDAPSGVEYSVASVTYTITPTPEPASLLLLGSGIAFLGWCFRRQIS